MHQLPRSSFKILLQHEQTVLSHKHPQDWSFPSSTPEDDSSNFLARLYGPKEGFFAADRIIDYSNANFHHVLGSDEGYLYKAKASYVAPLLGGVNTGIWKRPALSLSTMFGSPGLGRRGKLLERLERGGFEVSNVAEYDNLDLAFFSTSLLINYRQFNHFQTLEELRILPAMMRGVVVFSEKGPLWDHVSYAEHIQSFSKPDVVARLQHVINHYDEIWDAIFCEAFPRTLGELKEANERTFMSIVNQESK